MMPAMKALERVIEQVLWGCRLFVLPAVAASLLGALLLVVVGTAEIVGVAIQGVDVLRSGVDVGGYPLYAVGRIIAAVDAFLVGTVLLIFGIGLYELFVSKIDAAETDGRSSRVLVVHSLDDLKERLGKVVVMALVVTFFKQAVEMKNDAQTLAFYALAVLLISGAFFLLNVRGRREDD